MMLYLLIVSTTAPWAPALLVGGALLVGLAVLIRKDKARHDR